MDILEWNLPSCQKKRSHYVLLPMEWQLSPGQASFWVPKIEIFSVFELLLVLGV